MTHKVSPMLYPTKEAFKAAVEKNPSQVYLNSLDIVDESLSGTAQAVAFWYEAPILVTNHAVSGWTAYIEVVDGEIVVT